MVTMNWGKVCQDLFARQMLKRACSIDPGSIKAAQGSADPSLFISSSTIRLPGSSTTA